MTRVSKLMTKKLITVDLMSSVDEAVSLLRQRGVRHLLVIHKGEMVGIISDRDINRALNPSRTKKRVMAIGGLYFLLEPILVEEIMTADPVTIGPSTSVHEATRLMLEHHFGALPVLRDGQPVGIVTESDLLRYYDAQQERTEVGHRRPKKRPTTKKRAPGA
jgi:CBS domain-containing protein